jgi:hypothetical protein
MPKKKSETQLSQKPLRAEWVPAYGIKLQALPWLTILGRSEEEALRNLARFKFAQRRDHHIEYDIDFINEPFIIE